MKTPNFVNPRLNSRTMGFAAVGALVASFALVGCSKTDDSVMAQAEQKSTELKNDAATGMEKAKESAREAVADVKQAGAEASAKVSDAAITTAVNAELAKDSNLSATKIDVDTEAGRVELKGTAPSSTAKERATTLASSVKGVTSVDNQLMIEAGKM